MDELYRDFAKSQRDIAQKISAALKENDMESARLMAHSLKSLAGLIKKENLRQLAAEAESAIKRNEITDGQLAALGGEVAKVIATLDAAIAPPEKPEPLSAEKTEKLLNELQTYLSQSDGKVLTLLPVISAIPNTEKLIEYIENYDFEAALKEMSNIAN